LNNVRPQDVESFEKNGEIWVVENSGGISTFANQGTIIPDALSLVNDYGNHWAWEPATMKLDDYKAALQSLAAKFYKKMS
jgi:hypothetical protein